MTKFPGSFGTFCATDLESVISSRTYSFWWKIVFRDHSLGTRNLSHSGQLISFGFLSVAQWRGEFACNAGDTGCAGFVLGQEDLLDLEMATRSVFLPRNLWTE